MQLEKIIKEKEEGWGVEKNDLVIIIAGLHEEIEALKNREPVPSGSKFKMYVDLKKDNKKLEKQLEKTQKDLKQGGAASGRNLLNKKRIAAASAKSRGSGLVGSENDNNNNGVERSGSAPNNIKGKRGVTGAPPKEVMW